jgi:hypothetical protein
VTNTLSYHDAELITTVKSFEVQAPWVGIIKVVFYSMTGDEKLVLVGATTLSIMTFRIMTLTMKAYM